MPEGPKVELRKLLWDLLGFAVAVFLLFKIMDWGHNGLRGQAIDGLVVLVAMMFFWNRLRPAQAPQTDDAGETAAMPENRKEKFDFNRVINIGLFGLWLVTISIGAGLFGKSPYLDYVFKGTIAIGLATIFIRHFFGRKVDNSN